MRIILLKSQIFKMVCGGKYPRRVRVPGLVEFQPCTDVLLDITVCKGFTDQLKDKRKTLGLSMDHDFTVCVSVDVSNENGKVELETSQQTLDAVQEILKDTNAQFQATVCLIGFSRTEEGDSILKSLVSENPTSFHTKEMTLEQKDDYFVGSDNTVKVNLPMRPILNGSCGSFYATVIVSMTTSKICLDPVSNQETQMRINRSILNDEVASDVEIVCGSETSVKCHRNFLIANSPVFAAMFKNGKEEAKKGQIQMLDKSEQVVRAFLAFMYFRDFTEPNKKLEVAFELLDAGHKYQIPDMEDVMTNVIKYKPLEWFDDVDVTTKLYLFARNATDGDGDELKKKAIVVLKKKHSELQKSSTFRDLFQYSPAIAMELCQDLAGVEVQ